MKDFMEKWRTDSKFKTKIKLILYTLFVVAVALFAVSSQNNVPTNTIENNNTLNDNNIDEQNYASINIPKKYKYTHNIKINEKAYQYSGEKSNEKETINKKKDEVIETYIYQNNNYYRYEEGSYILTTKDEVYDIIKYDYLKLETINEYLKKSTKENNQYIIYLKDMILDSSSNEYISIILDENKINIDYTSLMKKFDNEVEKYEIEILIEEIE